MFDIADRLENKPGSRGRRLRTAIILFLTLLVYTSGLSWAAEGQNYRADEWITECDPGPSTGAADCSITVPFWQTRGDPSGSFALVVMLQTGNIGIVGQPFPVRAVLRVDKNPPARVRWSAGGRLAPDGHRSDAPPKSGSQETRRWRETDSNPRSPV
jgi:hypothetical protein